MGIPRPDFYEEFLKRTFTLQFGRDRDMFIINY